MKRVLKHKTLFYSCLATIAAAGGCVTVQGGDKPIKVDMTVTFKVDQELDQFFAFQQKYDPNTGAPITQPAAPTTQPTTLPTGS